MRAVEVGEQFTDGLASEDDIVAVYQPLAEMTDLTEIEQALANMVASTCSPPDDLHLNLGCVWGDALQATKGEAIQEVVRFRLSQLVRDVLRNPFRPVTISPAVRSWNDGLVTRLAQAAYDNRHLPEGTLDNGRLAILADALEEAGCTDADILGHLRGPGPHVRGCWPLDLVLGKS